MYRTPVATKVRCNGFANEKHVFLTRKLRCASWVFTVTRGFLRESGKKISLISFRVQKGDISLIKNVCHRFER